MTELELCLQSNMSSYCSHNYHDDGGLYDDDNESSYPLTLIDEKSVQVI